MAWNIEKIPIILEYGVHVYRVSESLFQEEINSLAERCTDINLLLNVNKTKELIVDLEKEANIHTSVYINGAEVERVNNFRFLGIAITGNLSWSSHISTLTNTAQNNCTSSVNLKGPIISLTSSFSRVYIFLRFPYVCLM